MIVENILFLSLIISTGIVLIMLVLSFFTKLFNYDYKIKLTFLTIFIFIVLFGWLLSGFFIPIRKTISPTKIKVTKINKFILQIDYDSSNTYVIFPDSSFYSYKENSFVKLEYFNLYNKEIRIYESIECIDKFK